MRRLAAFNLRHLEGVVALCRTGSFSAAADKISLTQSALTQAVAALEQRLGCRLFIRGPRGARPTPEVAKLAPRIEHALELLNSVGRELALSTHHSGSLIRRLSLTQLIALASVERCGSFRRAARDCGLAQASIHRAVRDLEVGLGLPLIVKSRAGVSATRAASALAHATRLAYGELELTLEALKTGATRTVVIGVTPTLQTGRLTNSIGEACRRDSTAKFRIEAGSYEQMVVGLLDGKIDFLLSPLHSQVEHELMQDYVFDEYVEILARADHPLIRNRGQWRLGALADYPWIAHPDGTLRRKDWEQMMLQIGVQPPAPRFECRSVGTMRGLLLTTDALAMVPLDHLTIEKEYGVLVRLPGLPTIASRKIAVTTRAAWEPEPIHRFLIEALKQVGPGKPIT